MTVPQHRHIIGSALPPFCGPVVRDFVQEGMAWLYDLDEEIFFDALLMRHPSLSSTDTYGLHARDRRIRLGPSENQSAIVTRLVSWLTQHALAGLPMGLLFAVQAFLAPVYPRVRIVTRNGLWYTLEENAVPRALALPGYEPLPSAYGKDEIHEKLRGSGLYTRAEYPGVWNWDSLSNPENELKWWHYWMVVYPGSGGPVLPFQTPYDTGDWVYDDASSWGFAYAHGNIAVLRTVIREFSTANARCVAAVVTEDINDLDPTSPTAGDPPVWPDGWWGQAIKDDGMGGSISTRRTDLRYIFTRPNQ